MIAGRYSSLFEPAVWEHALCTLVAANGVGDAVLGLMASGSPRDNHAAVLLELLDSQREEAA